MFDIAFAEDRKVVLVRFRQIMCEADFTALDRLGARVRRQAEYDCIVDLTFVEQVELAAEFVAKRGDLPQAFKDRERIYVVPQPDLKLLVRLYACYQENRGWRPPTIVRTIDEAFERLCVAAADFRPFALT